MSTQPQVPEAGLRNKRLYFIRESEFGVWGADPDMNLYSDTISNYSFTPGATLEERRGVGDPDLSSHERGPESHEFTINYDLVKWPSATGDASYDGLVRDADNLLPSSHTVIERETKETVAADATVAGNVSRAQRVYTVAQGSLVDEVTVTGDPGSSQQITVELSYQIQKMRTYKIDQPTSGEGPTELVIASDNAADTNVDVTIEDEGAATAETVSTDGSDGTTEVSTTGTFSDIDAIEITGDFAGTITVSVNTGSATAPTAGDALAEIDGSGSYDGVESDDGVPALGAGTQETAGSLGAPENFMGDTIQQGGSPIRHEIASGTLSVSNNVASQVRNNQFGMALYPGNRNVTFSATMYGEDTSYHSLEQHLQNTAQDIVWTLDGGTFTLTDATLTSPGDRAAEEGNAVMTVDNEFTAASLTIA